MPLLKDELEDLDNNLDMMKEELSQRLSIVSTIPLALANDLTKYLEELKELIEMMNEKLPSLQETIENGEVSENCEASNIAQYRIQFEMLNGKIASLTDTIEALQSTGQDDGDGVQINDILTMISELQVLVPQLQDKIDLIIGTINNALSGKIYSINLESLFFTGRVHYLCMTLEGYESIRLAYFSYMCLEESI